MWRSTLKRTPGVTRNLLGWSVEASVSGSSARPRLTVSDRPLLDLMIHGFYRHGLSCYSQLHLIVMFFRRTAGYLDAHTALVRAVFVEQHHIQVDIYC
jgi:hypothetical protein